MITPKKKKPVHYVNNPDLLIALSKYTAEYKKAKETGSEIPKISEYIGECILLIATKLSNSPNFCSYSYKEDMVADGIENCLSYIHNFNPEKSSNAFAYITQICWFAAIRRIAKEKKQKLIKSEMIKNSGILDMDFDTQFGDSDDYKSSFLEFLKANIEPDKPDVDVPGTTKRKIIKKTTKAYQAQKKLSEQREAELIDFSENKSKRKDEETFDEFVEKKLDSIDTSENLDYNTLDEIF